MTPAKTTAARASDSPELEREQVLEAGIVAQQVVDGHRGDRERCDPDADPRVAGDLVCHGCVEHGSLDHRR